MINYLILIATYSHIDGLYLIMAPWYFEKISGVSSIVVPVMTTLFLCTAGVALELQLHLLDSASYLACGDFSITAPGPPLML